MIMPQMRCVRTTGHREFVVEYTMLGQVGAKRLIFFGHLIVPGLCNCICYLASYRDVEPPVEVSGDFVSCVSEVS